MIKPNQNNTRSNQAAHKHNKSQPKTYKKEEIDKIIKTIKFVNINENYAMLSHY